METTTKHNSHIGFTSILGRFKGIFVLLLMLLSTLTAGAETVTLTRHQLGGGRHRQLQTSNLWQYHQHGRHRHSNGWSFPF